MESLERKLEIDVRENAISSGNDNVTYQALRSAAREDEKRRLQIEMRKRETELLNKIKQQQKELESMKQEKSKVHTYVCLPKEVNPLCLLFISSTC